MTVMKQKNSGTSNDNKSNIGGQQQFLFRALLLLFNMLEHDKANQKELMNIEGLQIIGYLLNEYNRLAWSRESLIVLDKLAVFASSTGWLLFKDRCNVNTDESQKSHCIESTLFK